MGNFQKKSKWRSIMESKLVLIILGVILMFFAWNVLGLLGKMEETAKNKKISEAKVAELQNSKEKLSSDIEKLKTEAGQEEIIREKYGLAKSGEGAVVIVDDKSTEDASKAKKSNWFMSFFENLFN
jgi:cell division protein FtsB